MIFFIFVSIFYIFSVVFCVRDDAFLEDLLVEEEKRHFIKLDIVPRKCREFIEKSLNKYPVRPLMPMSTWKN